MPTPCGPPCRTCANSDKSDGLSCGTAGGYCCRNIDWSLQHYFHRHHSSGALLSLVCFANAISATLARIVDVAAEHVVVVAAPSCILYIAIYFIVAMTYGENKDIIFPSEKRSGREPSKMLKQLRQTDFQNM